MRRRLERIEGYVWCDRLGEVHENNLDPYEYGPPNEGEDDSRCLPTDHVAVYARMYQ